MRLLLDTHAFIAIPFDLLLVAQAISEAVPIVSADRALDLYSVTRTW